jgi:translation initiation factor IF-3
MSHAEIGRQIFDRILVSIGENAKIELAPKMEGKQIMMILVPKTTVA